MTTFGQVRRVLAPNPSAMTAQGTNTWIVGRGAVAVIDPGPDDARHLEAILSALEPGERVSHILVTHAHRDHSGLAPALAARTGAPVLAFGGATDGMRPTMAARGLTGDGGEGIDAGFAPDLRLGDGAVVEGSGWRLEALHTPGHLGNHLCFAMDDLCFTGDHVMGWSTSIVSPPEGDMTAYMASLAELARRRWSAFLPGHGPDVADPAQRLAELAGHRRQRERDILSALEDGPADAGGIALRLYTATPPALMRAAERNVLAHLLDLEERMLVAADAAPGRDTPFRLA
jgi:glyoxylase-like metal-dependent hydrolase (beta-lactamase superfamily II)